MKWMKTLKFRLIVTMMSLVVLVILIISVSVISNQRQQIEHQIREDLQSLASLLATNTTSSLLFYDDDSATQTLKSLQVRPDIRRAVIYDTDGQPFATYLSATSSSKLSSENVKNTLTQSAPKLYDDNEGLHLLMPIMSHDEPVGVLYLLDDLTSLKTQMHEFYRLVALTAVIAFFASLMATLWLVSLFIMPVNALLATIRDITQHRDYRCRAPEAVMQEFSELSSSFNQMISEIERRGDQLEQVNSELEQRVKARTEALETALEVANQANQAKAEFLAVMSHEVRTPLNGVIGFAELLKLQQLDQEAEDTVALLNESAQTLLALLNQILDFSKLDADKVELESQHFNIQDFMQSVLETNLAKAERKGLQLKLELGGYAGSVRGDPFRLRQILNNLIDNAIKFTDEGEVRIEAIARQQNGEHWIDFAVEDTGSGISQAKLETVFSPFAQADSSVTRKYGGTGLGLAICVQLIELMQGQHGVDSRVDHGSRFWFRLPMPESSQSAVDKPLPALRSRQLPEASTGLVLIAEDNAINQSVAEGMLRSMGYRTEMVANGLEAISHCLQQRYDLILMDYHMPRMGGLEATRQIRAEGLNCQTPLIALTADVQKQVETDFYQAGADVMLVKPFQLEQLAQAIKQCLSAQDESEHDSPHIDDAVLAEIRAMSGEDGESLINHIATLYMQNSPELIDDIHDGSHSGDSDKLFRAAHALKSSSANIGAVRVSELARKLEHLARHNQPEQAPQHLEALRDSYRDACATLRVRMGET
jgi:signal transduction histidine kinase/CheY-like chemotaxis protein